MIDIEKAREYFKNDRFATEAGAVIEELTEDYCRCSMEITEKHCNALGGVMGGAIFTLADLAFAVLSNWGKNPCVSQENQISFLGKAKGKKLIAECRPVKRGKSTSFYVIEVKDELDNKVAYMTGNGFELRG